MEDGQLDDVQGDTSNQNIINEALLFFYDNLIMKKLARYYNLKIIDVPGDGDCFFHAVSYSLPSVGLPAISGPKLRSHLVRYFETTKHKENYIGFLVISIKDGDSPRLITQKQMYAFRLYIIGLRRGKWADNLAVQGTADMLNININVITTNTPKYIIRIHPQRKKSDKTITIGLLGELHYVAFEKL